MAEHSNLRDNSARLRRNMSKLAFRSREKVMRSIGRSEETKDEILDHYVMLINKQQIQMQKLQRDMKQYLSALKAMSFSQKAFYDSLYEIYDDDWSGKDVIASCSQRNQMLHDDIFARFQAEVTDVLQNHLAEYLDCKVKVEKRGRKLVDYDAARRSLHSLETAKKPDPSKVEKATEHVQQAKESYESLNNELHDRLPTIYDSRLPICVETFSSICESERLFSNEVAEMHSKLKNVFSSLNTAFEKGEYHIQRMPPPLDNGRVAPSSSDGSTRTSNDSPAKSVVSSQQTPSKSHNDDALPPRYPGEALPSSPSSDPSSHEYVNLQIGPLSDVVQPVTEEEENGTQNNADKIKSEIGYLSPNVANKREEVGYIMASDPSLSRNSVPAKISRPQPSPRSQIFRNPSDAKISRPPIPKPLPRTLSAPTTKRPSHLKQNHQSMHGNWKGPRDQYTDVHLRSTNGHKTKSTSSHQRQEYTKQATMTANGDHISFQPIYEEPPNEEDLPSFQKEQKEKQSVPKSPTKSDDSQKYLDLPPDYLFSVQALYQYKSTDDDELGFDKGEVVHIVKHPDPEEQDEGWQMGVRQKDWEENGSSAGMGVFPENFTKRIQL